VEETVPEPACPGEEISGAHPRGKEGQQSMAGVCGVPDDAVSSLQAALELDGLNVREWSSSNALDGFYHTLQSFTVCDRAVTIPHWDVVRQDALDGTAVKINQDPRRHVDLLQSPQEEETLVGLLGQG